MMLLSRFILLIFPFLIGAKEVAIVFPEQHWITKQPSELGLNKKRLKEFVEKVGGDGCIIKDGYLVYSWGDQKTQKWWASASKPVLSTLLLLAIQEGKLESADDPVASLNWKLSSKDRNMTFRHLANMTSAYASVETPGTAWGYNDYAIELYARSLEKIFGDSLADTFDSRFAQLQFEDKVFIKDQGVVASPRDFARLAWLWLNHGRWNSKEIISRNLFDTYIRRQVPKNLKRAKTGVAPNDYLKIGSYGGGINQTPHGPGVYGFNFWFNEMTPSGKRVWPSAPADTYQANGLWNRDTVTIIPSLKMLISLRDAHPGKFDPGNEAGPYNKNLELLMSAVLK